MAIDHSESDSGGKFVEQSLGESNQWMVSAYLSWSWDDHSERAHGCVFVEQLNYSSLLTSDGLVFMQAAGRARMEWVNGVIFVDTNQRGT
jgi:hypothetical protein